MKNSILKIALAAAVLIGSGVYVGAATVSATGEGFAGEDTPGICKPEKQQMRQARHLALMNEVLDLSADQKQQIEVIFDKARESHQTLRSQMREDRLKFRELTASGSFDETAVRTLAESMAKRKVELLVERARVKSEIFTLLTPEQQEKAKNLHDLMEPRRHGKGGWH